MPRGRSGNCANVPESELTEGRFAEQGAVRMAKVTDSLRSELRSLLGADNLAKRVDSLEALPKDYRWYPSVLWRRAVANKPIANERAPKSQVDPRGLLHPGKMKSYPHNPVR